MTEQQLRAVRRKHLIIIIRDLERDLQKALVDKEQLMRAYQYGLERRQQDNDIYAELLDEIPMLHAVQPRQQTPPQLYTQPVNQITAQEIRPQAEAPQQEAVPWQLYAKVI